jgi:hypothetical protein
MSFSQPEKAVYRVGMHPLEGAYQKQVEEK